MIELGHTAVTANHRLQHAHHGIRAEPMSLGHFFDQLLAGGGEFSHGDLLKVFPYTGLYKPRRRADCLIFAILGELPRLENQRYRASDLDRVVPAITRMAVTAFRQRDRRAIALRPKSKSLFPTC